MEEINWLENFKDNLKKWVEANNEYIKENSLINKINSNGKIAILAISWKNIPELHATWRKCNPQLKKLFKELDKLNK